MLIDLLRMIAGKSRAGGRDKLPPQAAGLAGRHQDPSKRVRKLALIASFLQLPVLADVYLFMQGMTATGIALAVVMLFAHVLVFWALSRAVEEAKLVAARRPVEARPAAPAVETVRHPSAPRSARVNLSGRIWFSSLLWVISAVCVIAGGLMSIAFVIVYLGAQGHLPGRGVAEAVIVETMTKCRLRGPDGKDDRFVDEGLCQLRGASGTSQGKSAFVVIRFPVEGGALHTVEVMRDEVTRKDVAVGDEIPITYRLDDPDKVRKGRTNALKEIGMVLPIPLLLFLIGYGAARWRRNGKRRRNPEAASAGGPRRRAMARGKSWGKPC